MTAACSAALAFAVYHTYSLKTDAAHPNYRPLGIYNHLFLFHNFLDALFLSFGCFLVYKLLDVYKHFIPKQARIQAPTLSCPSKTSTIFSFLSTCGAAEVLHFMRCATTVFLTLET
ncbi:hypothetical protein HYPSUDRAFT_45393 [Hypholoma sublateritium FD-334 SS-4]|uniref:Uncharacterized protein n=1 Tax=Hypholoma sublateritium (strain FD-334 SS-4) TaxID=945553 RepID=A0A0D2NNC6_HYPSF|nr:hypothetical protein HYPSUDRAFT_45393 [Hypholoma sublateritium FD-334 SS-4]